MEGKKSIISSMLRKIVLVSVFSILFFLTVTLNGYAQGEIFQIQIEGNNLISDAKIVSQIRVKAGQPYSDIIVDQDIKNLYQTGYFEDISTDIKETPEGVILTFKVKEKPVVNKISIVGQRHIRETQILEVIGIEGLEEGGFIDDYRLRQAVRKIEGLYAQRGFSQAKIEYQVNPVEEGKVDLDFIITEEGLIKVRAVNVKGNETFSDNQIRKLMKTRRAWLFNRGIFRESQFKDDLGRITAFYHQEGFTDMSLDPDIEYRREGVYITLNIQEGERYYLGSIEIKGNKEIATAKIYSSLTLSEDDVFSEAAVYYGASEIRQLYVDHGYIFAQADPVSVLNLETGRVDLTYNITEGYVAYVEDIQIRGNVKTKDIVIRRELEVYPAERFDGEKLRKSRQNLENLGFFEEIRILREPGSKRDKVDLIFEVQEAKTGYFSFGGGYSSIDAFIGFVELRQRNFDYRNWSTFTGAGQDLSLKAEMGTVTSRYQLSFTNPWIFDRPVSFGFDAYRKGHDKDSGSGYSYSEKITGGALRLGRRLTDRTSGRVTYRFDNVKISDVDDDASDPIKDEEGSYNLSSGELALIYDSRDSVFSPRSGIYFSNTFQLTGSFFGGDKDFSKFFSRLSLYFPAFNDSVLETRFRAGWAETFSDTSKVPIYERFFAGGAGTVRGYRERKVGPIDDNSDDPLGGEALFVANIEYTYPLIDFLKVAVFYDIGNVWDKSSNFFKSESDRKEFYSSIGLGLRVNTPIGPVSVDYGWPLDLEPGETSKSGRFHFNVSRDF